VVLITVLLGKYDLAAHITALTPAADRTAEWQRQDYVVRSWLYGSISEDILDTIMAQDQTAYEAYALIRNLFLDNQLTRAVYLEAQFRAIVQGDLTVTAYCHRLKALSDALADVGQPVTDQTLVLTCLRGLNPRFSDITTLVTMQVPAPTFLQTRSLLLLRENQLANSAPGGIVPSQVALYGQTAGPSTGGNQGGNGGNGGRWQKKKKAVTGGAPGSNAAYPAAAPGPWICFNPYTGQTQAMQPTWRPSGAPAPPPGGPGLLGPRPNGPTPRPPTWVPPGQQAYVTQLAPLHGQAFGVNSPPPATLYNPGPAAPAAPSPAWDCSALIAALNSTASTSNAGSANAGTWVMDSGATSHMVNNAGILSSLSPHSTPSRVTVGNGVSLPISNTGHAILHTPTQTFHLNNVLVVPDIIKNLLSTRQFTIDNSVSVEYDPFGFSVKDLRTRREIIRCSSTGPLYEFFAASSSSPSHFGLAASTTPTELWHRRLGHPGRDAASHLAKDFSIRCNKDTMVCHACQLGKHVRLPFSRSKTICVVPFQLLHCDLWTSPVASNSGYKFYLVIVDDFSHYMWTFPLRRKSDTCDLLINFVAYARTQFQLPVVAFQTDNGTEFVNSTLLEFLTRHGIHLRMSCPYTSPQNGKAERALRTINDVTRTLLFQAHMPPSYWAEALAAATYLLNRRPSQPIDFRVPYTILYNQTPSYSDLRVFGCLCYPNQSATATHKLAPRSTACVFLGYPSSHRGYRCLDMSSRRIITSRHVIFDENSFPFAHANKDQQSDSLDFLLELAATQPTPAQHVASPAQHGAPPV
jgi:histone deacetylase 1/2